MQNVHLVGKEHTGRIARLKKDDPVEEELLPTLFVMMPFALEYRWVFDEVIVPAAQQLGISVSRMDEEAFVGSISKKIEKKIDESTFLLADISDNNPNVLYELGLAHGKSYQDRTILITKDSSTVPFDISDYVVIEYGTPRAAVSFKDRVIRAISSIITLKTRQ